MVFKLSPEAVATVDEVVEQYDLTAKQREQVLAKVTDDVLNADTYWKYRPYNSAHVHCAAIERKSE